MVAIDHDGLQIERVGGVFSTLANPNGTFVSISKAGSDVY